MSPPPNKVDFTPNQLVARLRANKVEEEEIQRFYNILIFSYTNVYSKIEPRRSKESYIGHINRILKTMIGDGIIDIETLNIMTMHDLVEELRDINSYTQDLEKSLIRSLYNKGASMDEIDCMYILTPDKTKDKITNLRENIIGSGDSRIITGKTYDVYENSVNNASYLNNPGTKYDQAEELHSFILDSPKNFFSYIEFQNRHGYEIKKILGMRLHQAKDNLENFLPEDFVPLLSHSKYI